MPASVQPLGRARREGGLQPRPADVPGDAQLDVVCGDHRDEIIAACAALARDGGEAAVTMRAVALRCGTSATDLYRYFDGKDSMLQTLQMDLCEQLARWLEDDGAGGTAFDRLHRLCVRYVAYARERPHLYGIVFRPVAGDGEPLPGIEAFVGAASPLVRRVAPVRNDIVGTCRQLWAALHGITFVLSPEVPGARPDVAQRSFIEGYVERILRGLLG